VAKLHQDLRAPCEAGCTRTEKLPVSQALQQRVCRHDAFTPTQDSATRGRMVDQRRLIGPFINKPQARFFSLPHSA
jgi:hypothetical protein